MLLMHHIPIILKMIEEEADHFNNLMLHLALVVTWVQEVKETQFILDILLRKPRNHQEFQQPRQRKIWMHFEKDLTMSCCKFLKKNKEKKTKEKLKYKPFQIPQKQKE